MPGGTLRGSDWGGECPAFALLTRAWEACWAPRLGPPPSKAPSRMRGSWRHRREAGGEEERQQEGPSRTGGAGEEQRAFAPPTWAQEASWAPSPGPLSSETRGRPGPLLFH